MYDFVRYFNIMGPRKISYFCALSWESKYMSQKNMTLMQFFIPHILFNLLFIIFSNSVFNLYSNTT